MRTRAIVGYLAVAIFSSPVHPASEGESAFRGKEALNKFLTAYEPEIPWLVEHYVKNRRITCIRTLFDKERREIGTMEYRLLSSASCIRVEVASVRAQPAKTDGSPPSQERAKDPPRHDSKALDPWKPTQLTVLRPDAYFRLTRNKIGTFVIAGLAPGGPIEDGRKYPDVAEAFIPFALGREYYSDLVRSPAMEVISMSERALDGEQVVALHFRAAAGDRRGVFYYFDSKNHWVFRGMDQHNSATEELSCYRFKYGRTVDGVAVPLKLELFREEPGGQRKLEDVYEFVEFATAHPDASEFTLAQYGLSEKPPVPEPVFGKGFGLHIILIAGGLLLAGLAIAIYTFARTKPAKPA